jgi:hypothetical protein
MSSIYENDLVDVTYNGDLKLGKITWKRTPENIHEYQQPFLILIEYARHHPVTKFLSDNRDQGNIPNAYRRVFINHILPQAVTAGVKAGASVADMDVLKRFYLNQIMRSLGKYRLPYKVFISQQNAINWLIDRDKQN